MRKIRYCLNQLPELVRDLWPTLKRHRVVALHGDLGAGKTTFTAALCRFLQVEETPSSPTFSLINCYHYPGEEGGGLIYHSDWYRINSAADADNAGIRDMLDSDYSLCLIEWPERLPEMLPEHTLHLRFEARDDKDERLLFISESSDSWPHIV